MNSHDADLKWIHTAQEPKWDFVLFRCTYDDDEAWSQCMEILQARTSASLHQQDGIVMLNWVVREDRELDGADADTVRSRFRKLCSSWNKPHAVGPCYEACILIDSSSLLSIVAAPESDDSNQDVIPYVNVIDVLYDTGKSYEKQEYRGVVRVGVHQLAQLFTSIREQSLDRLYPGSDSIWESVNGSGKEHDTMKTGH